MDGFAYRVAVVANTRATTSLVETESGLQCVHSPSASIPLLPNDVALVLVAGWEVNGFGVCRRLREESSIPIILLVDEVSPRMRVLGLQAGADVVLGKDALGQELRAHAKALMRRCFMPAPLDAYRLLRHSTF